MGRRRAEEHNSTEHLFLEREAFMLRFPVQEVKLVRMHLIGSQVLRSHIRLLGLLQSPTHRGRMHAQMVGS